VGRANGVHSVSRLYNGIPSAILRGGSLQRSKNHADCEFRSRLGESARTDRDRLKGKTILLKQ
jgi:hypothetical protein